MKKEFEEGKKEVNNYLRYSGLGFQIAGTIAVGFFIGYQLDKWLHTKQPYFTVAISGLFVFLGLYIGLKDFLRSK
jgi:F0F1-type ATP synthase assembly protein I